MKELPVTSPTHKAVMAVLTPAAAWAVTKVLDQRKIKQVTKKLDRRITTSKASMGSTLASAFNRSTKNPGYLAAAFGALVVSLGLFTRAATK